MNDAAGGRREIAALRERLDALTAAILRVNASLDVDTVMRETAAAARALTGARYAVITVVDGDGALEDFVVSGFTAAEETRVFEWTDNLRVFERLRDLSGALRVADMPAYIDRLGFSTDGVIIKTFLGTSMRHRGALIGHFFLGEKRAAAEFSDADEELLVLFAAQAAAAVANARAHRAERRRAGASRRPSSRPRPVGVIVFDAPGGRPQSMNREAWRLIDRLRHADAPAEPLPRAAVCRFADGREIALDARGDHADLSRILRADQPDLVLLDLVLPGADGIELMRTVPELAALPVVFISAYGRDETIAKALAAGAADYLVKPFSPTELVARVGAALRRAQRPEPFTLGDLEIHYEEHRVTVAGRDVELTTTEYRLLRVLSLGAGRVVTFDALLRQVWPGRGTGESDLVRNFVKKLRAKLGGGRRQPDLDLQRARRRLPDAGPACAMSHRALVRIVSQMPPEANVHAGLGREFLTRRGPLTTRIGLAPTGDLGRRNLVGA